MDYKFKQLFSTDVSSFKDLIILFGKVFKEKGTYQGAKPSDTYINKFLSNDSHIILVTIKENIIIGGLVAYELYKFEQERSEIYIYDLAVSKNYRRKGIGTSLIENLIRTAKERGAPTIFVQADKADKGAVTFYKSLHAKLTDTYMFDIELK